MKLTYKACETAKPKEKTYKLADGHGMYLEIRPNGSRYWRIKYRFGGKEKLLALGVYPQVSLKEAREKRAEARKLLEKNIDPVLIKKKNRLKAYDEAANTFKSLTRAWHDCPSSNDLRLFGQI